MSELRIKLLDLAIQAGATIENAKRVATDWERWATEDDPLRLGVPNISDESYEDQLERVFTEEQVGIDWDRPQLVHLIDDPDFIVRTTGLVGFDEFQGYSDADGDIPDWYKKKRFEYHGEIEEPKNHGNKKPSCNGTCGANYCDENGCLDKKEVVGTPRPIEIDWSRPQLVKSNLSGCIIKTNGVHEVNTFSGVVMQKGDTAWPAVGDSNYEWLKSNFTYHGEIIPQEQPTEEKTTGLNFVEPFVKVVHQRIDKEKTAGLTFSEAMISCGNNLIARPNNAVYGFDEYNDLRMKTGSTQMERRFWVLPVLKKEDFTATDWQIIEP